LRKSGIRVIGDVPWGGHLCIFYETREDLLLDTAASYFAAGLQSNEFCVWAISDPITQADAKDALRLAVPDLDRRLAAERMEILPGSEWYLKGDQFDPKRVTSGWNEKLQGALANGYEGIRVSGDTFWVETNHWKAFCEYEQELDRSLANRKMTNSEIATVLAISARTVQKHLEHVFEKLGVETRTAAALRPMARD
jgi:hypothetical protein